MTDFFNDRDKMRDFKMLKKEDFLATYSYLNEEAYQETEKVFNKLKVYLKEYHQVESGSIFFGNLSDNNLLAEKCKIWNNSVRYLVHYTGGRKIAIVEVA